MRRRDWPALDPALFAAALVAYALALPRGVARLAAAPTVTEALALGGTEHPSVAPLAALAIRLVAFLPLGDLGGRANLASALLGAVAVAAVGRVCLEALATLRPLAETRVSLRGFLYEPVAAAGAAAVAALALGTFHAATTAGSAAATVAVVACGWIAILRLARALADKRAGLALAACAGLAGAVEPIAAPLLWPPLALLWLLGLRRGERWPLVAPLLFVAMLAAALFTVAVADAPMTMAALRARLWPPTAGHPMAAALELGEQLGVVALLLAGAGAIALLWRAAKLGVLAVYPLAVALVHAAGPPALSTALVIALTATAIPLAVGIAHVAGRLGRARVPGAATLAVIAVVSPVLDGGVSRWTRDARLTARLIDRALAGAPPRAVVDPGTPEMRALLRHAGVVGLRPDVVVRGPLSRLSE